MTMGILPTAAPQGPRSFEDEEASLVADLGAEADDIEARRKALDEIWEVLWIPNETVLQMRLGGIVWAATYARGQCRAAAVSLAAKTIDDRIAVLKDTDDDGKPFDFDPKTRQMHIDRMAWCAAWAISAFPQVTTTHTFAAALACTDVYPEAMAHVRSPWPAWRLHIPNGLLPIVGEDRTFEIRILEVEEQPGVAIVRAVVDGGITAFELESHGPEGSLRNLLVDGSFKPADDYTRSLVAEDAEPHARLPRVCRRLVAGVILAMQVKGASREHMSPARTRSKRAGEEPAHRNVVVGRPTRIDCRPALADYLAGRDRRARGPAAFQFMVRGHWRDQACGIGRRDRRPTWIEPHWKGAEGAPIVANPKRLGAAT